MTKIIWILISFNAIALLLFIMYYFSMTNGKSTEAYERSWTSMMVLLGIVIIGLAAFPLWYSQSTFSLIVSGFFAALPLAVGLGIYVTNKLPSYRKDISYAKTYYKDKTQQAIASAIEQGDTSKLKQLIVGQDVNIQGIKVWDWPGLNYLQFAIRIRSSSATYGFNEEANTAAIRILIAAGSATTPALPEAIKCLPPVLIAALLVAGADPNTIGFANSNPLLFEAIGSSKEEVDMAILLVRHGAKMDSIYKDGFTPVMFAAFNAGTSPLKKEMWRLVRYLLEEAHADVNHTTSEGYSLSSIISSIRKQAIAEKITMPSDFEKVVVWMDHHQQN